MGKVTITINTDNAAFEDEGQGNELARILHDLAEKYEDDYDFPEILRDINGNTVGYVEYK